MLSGIGLCFRIVLYSVGNQGMNEHYIDIDNII